jgi:hypothetical protein
MTLTRRNVMTGNDLVSWYLQVETNFRSGRALPHNDLADPNGDEVKDIGGGQTARLITGENRDNYVPVGELVETNSSGYGISKNANKNKGIGNINRP